MKQDDKDTGIDASKRRTLGALLVMLALQSVAGQAWAAAPEKDAAATVEDMKAFMRLSVFLTGVEKLDNEMAQKIFAYMFSEPWGKEHFEQVCAKLSPIFMVDSSIVPRWQLLYPNRFTEGERWFIRHLLTTWYTGVYYYEDKSQFIAYRRALMNAALLDVMPTPGYSDGPFGAWSTPPAGVIE